MLIDGLDLTEGSLITNLVVPTGTSAEKSAISHPNNGELFYQTDGASPGLYIYTDSVVWRKIATSYEVTTDLSAYLKKDGSVELAGHLIPEMTGGSGNYSLRNLGSATKGFNAVYTKEIYVSGSSLYVNGVKVIEDVSSTINFTADEDQNVTVKTTGTGLLKLLSDDEINFNAKGGIETTVPATQANKNITFENLSTNGDIAFTASGTGGQVQFVGAGGITFTGASTFNNNIAMVTNKITGLGDPTDNQDAATKSYVVTNAVTPLSNHTGSTSNPHSVTKTQVGLSNVTNDAQLKIASNLSDLNSVSTARTNLGLVAGGTGDIWVEKAGDTMSGDLNMGTKKITNLGEPADGTDAATKNYVGTVAAGLSPHASCKVATTQAITLSGLQEIDGYQTIAGDRVLVKDQSNNVTNGVYAAASGAWSRVTDMDGSPANEVTGGEYVFVTNGTTNGGTGWTILASGSVEVGVDPFIWTQFHAANVISAGEGLSQSGNVFNVNLGAGIAANPADEVGIDLYDVNNNPLILTSDGSARSTLTGAKLGLLLDGSTLSKGANGLKVNSSAVAVYDSGNLTINQTNTGFRVGQTVFTINGSQPIGAEFASWENAAGTKFKRWLGSGTNFSVLYAGQYPDGVGMYGYAILADDKTTLTDATSVRFFVNSTTGKVGLGTLTPSEKFQVVGGNILLDDTRSVFIGGNTVSDQSGVRLHYNYNGGTGSAAYVDVKDGTFQVRTGGSSPTTRLSISTTGATFTNTLTANGNILASGNATGLYAGGITETGANGIRHVADTTNGISYTDVKGNSYRIRVDNTDGTTTRMTILSDGKIGIGKVNPAHTLDVNGPIVNNDTVVFSSEHYSNTLPTLQLGDAQYGLSSYGGNLYTYSLNAGPKHIQLGGSPIQTYTYDIWTSGNDGTGSGLDADKLDGLQGSSFVRTDTSSTISSGTLSFGTRTGQHVTLWESSPGGAEFGFGIQPSTMYARIAGSCRFNIYQGGSHNGNENDAGGGTHLLAIESDGDIGVGTSAPMSRLHVHKAADESCYARFTNTTTGATSGDGLLVGINADEQGALWNYENTDLIFGTNNAEKLRIKPSGNAVFSSGVTTQAVTIAGTTNGTLYLQAPGANVDQRNWRITADAGSGTSSILVQALSDAGSGGGNLFKFIRTDSDITDFQGTNSGTAWFTVSNASKEVGIGTVDPSTPLHVYHGTEDVLATFESGDTIASIHLKDPDGTSRISRSSTGAVHIIGDAVNYNTSWAKVDTTGGVARFVLQGNGPQDCSLIYMTEQDTGKYWGFYHRDGAHSTPNQFIFSFYNGSTFQTAYSVTTDGKIQLGNELKAGAYKISGYSGAGGIIPCYSDNKGYWDADGFTWRSKDANTTLMTLSSTAGDLVATGNVTAYSDERMKTNISTIENALDKVSHLRGVEYTRTDTNTRGIGVIAQEVENVIPEVVLTNENGMKSVAYGNIVGLLVEAIKEQKETIARQQTQIDELMATVYNLVQGVK